MAGKSHEVGEAAFDHNLRARRITADRLEADGGRGLIHGQCEMSAADLLILCCGWAAVAAPN